MTVTISWAGVDQTYFIDVDATVSESHVFSNTVTDHPVERGANITDHVRPDPIRLSISGVISNQPHFLPRDHVGGAQLVNRQVSVTTPGITRIVPIPGVAVLSRIQAGTAQSATVRTFSAEFDRVRDVFDELVSLRDLGTLLDVSTHLRTYEDMVVESLSIPVDSSTGDALVFDLALKQVVVASTAVVAVPALPTRRKKKGTVSPEDATDSQASAARDSLAFGLFGG